MDLAAEEQKRKAMALSFRPLLVLPQPLLLHRPAPGGGAGARLRGGGGDARGARRPPSATRPTSGR
jgi:hypothetical protein